MIKCKINMKLSVQTDCKQVFEAINKGNNLIDIGCNLTRLIQKVLRSFKKFVIENILRETNYCADKLTRLSENYSMNILM